MNNIKHLMLSLVTINLFIISTTVWADFKSDIIASCSDYQKYQEKQEVNACKLYIDGFIDSALLTDDAVIEPKTITGHTSAQSSYLKRAYRTRVNDSAFLSTHQDIQFCLPQEYDRAFITSKIAKSIDITQLASKPLKEVLFETLIANFPCK
ncbi:hypothetical protein [Thalassotalea sp. G2M2-11]|uniref:Rap1a/Tai family immunity protein n=1 Tax=Thalassotalea sp. G2M2-11 TaxID=2787627 RepID=UPI0019D088F7|nr:hypothetical protein [Thalassotalea sp. G2M2-11]